MPSSNSSLAIASITGSATSPSFCTIHENTFSAAFGIFNVKTEIWEQFFKKILYNPLMGCSLFSNYNFQMGVHFQMGVTVIGFAEHFGPFCLSGRSINPFPHSCMGIEEVYFDLHQPKKTWNRTLELLDLEDEWSGFRDAQCKFL